MNGFKLAWIVAGILTGLLLVACAPPVLVDKGADGVSTASPTAPPETTVVETPSPPATPYTITQYALSITSAQASDSAGTAVAEQRIYPLREIAFTGSADGLVDLPGIGTPVLAMGRIITGTASAITDTAPITWLLFSAVDTPPWDTQWLQTRTDMLGEQVHETGIEHAINGTHVIAFPCCANGEEDLIALLEARDQWADEHHVKVWLENVLIRQTDEDGTETWVLWSFHNDPGGGAGAAGRNTFCNHYLRCTTATDRWATWVCGWYCQ